MLLLKNEQIDKQRWNECIAASPNGLIYAESFYLDAMCPGWSALADEQYNWVMPLTSRTKYGFRYLYQPAFCQQLGVFTPMDKSLVPWQVIMQWLQQHYRFCEVNLNFGNPAQWPAPANLQAATNYVLPLHQPHHKTWLRYSADLKRNLLRTKSFDLRYSSSILYTEAIDMYIACYALRMPHVTMHNYDRFKSLAGKAAEQQRLICRAALDDNGQIMAVVVLLRDDKRLYNMMNTTAAAGRKAGANHFLLNEVIREFSETGLMLDFEGSDLPGVKAFYQNFGATNQPYYHMRYNCLPWFARWLKG